MEKLDRKKRQKAGRKVLVDAGITDEKQILSILASPPKNALPAANRKAPPNLPRQPRPAEREPRLVPAEPAQPAAANLNRPAVAGVGANPNRRPEPANRPDIREAPPNIQFWQAFAPLAPEQAPIAPQQPNVAPGQLNIAPEQALAHEQPIAPEQPDQLRQDDREFGIVPAEPAQPAGIPRRRRPRNRNQRGGRVAGHQVRGEAVAAPNALAQRRAPLPRNQKMQQMIGSLVRIVALVFTSVVFFLVILDRDNLEICLKHRPCIMLGSGTFVVWLTLIEIIILS